MAGLLDIAPATAREVLRINGVRVVVRGLNANAIASIVARFPDLGVLLGGGGFSGPRLIAQFGRAVAPIIAAGFGHLEDEAYEKHAGELSAEDQLELINAIVRLTFPKGPFSFVEKLTALLTGDGEGEKPVKIRLRKSQPRSQDSSATASRPNMQ